MSFWVPKFDRMTRGGCEQLVNVSSRSGNQYFGKTVVTSNASGFFVTISTTIIRSDSLVRLGLQTVGSNGMANFTLGIRSLSHGGYFSAGTVNSVANVGSFFLMWEVVNTSPR